MGGTFRFGAYRLEGPTRRLLRDGEPVPLTPKAFDTLLALVERRERVVDKAELMRLLWPDSFVEDANLSQTIFILRRTLGEAPGGGPFIETVPRRGYRFAAEVQEDAEPLELASPARSARARTPLAVAASVILAAALGWIGASQLRSSGADATRVDSLAVLPIENLSGDAEQDYLADGMTDALITSLGRIGSLRVISRTSAMTYRATRKTLPQIGQELQVDAIVEGSIQRSADRVRLNLKLVHAASDRTLWAEAYDRSADDLLDLQTEATRAIAGHAGTSLTPGERARLADTRRVNPKAYEAYLKGRYFWNRRTAADAQKAIAHFEEALRHEANYAPAYAGLADSYFLVGSYGWTVPSDEAWDKAIAAADRAIALDDLLADGHTSRATIAGHYEWNWAKAEHGFRRALELNPGYATAHHWYGYHLMLTGRLEEAAVELQRALELDPLSPIINANIGFRLYVAREYDAAIAHWQRALEMHPDYRLLHSYMGLAYVGKGMYEEAATQIQKGYGMSGGGPSDLAVLAHTYARMGRTADARRLLATLRDMAATTAVPAYYIALVYVGLGEADRAFEWLDRAYQERSGPVNELSADPMFDRIRGDARFDGLLKRMGLPVTAAATPGTRE